MREIIAALGAIGILVAIFVVAFHDHPRAAELSQRLRHPRSKGRARKDGRARPDPAAAAGAPEPKRGSNERAVRDRGLGVLDGFRLGVGLILAGFAFWLVMVLLVMVFGVDGQITFGRLR